MGIDSTKINRGTRKDLQSCKSEDITKMSIPHVNEFLEARDDEEALRAVVERALKTMADLKTENERLKGETSEITCSRTVLIPGILKPLLQTDGYLRKITNNRRGTIWTKIKDSVTSNRAQSRA